MYRLRQTLDGFITCLKIVYYRSSDSCVQKKGNVTAFNKRNLKSVQCETTINAMRNNTKFTFKIEDLSDKYRTLYNFQLA